MHDVGLSFTSSLVLNRHDPIAGLILKGLRSPVLKALTAVNCLLIVVHVVVASSPSEDAESWTGFLRIDRDRSISEWFESVQLAAAILFLTVYAWQRRRSTGLMVAALLHVALWWLAPEQQAVAEFVMVAVVTPFLGGLAYLAYRRACQGERSELAAMLIVLSSFALFALVIDFLHPVLSSPGSILEAALSVVEEGGELVTLSVLLAVVIELTRTNRVQPPESSVIWGVTTFDACQKPHH